MNKKNLFMLIISCLMLCSSCEKDIDMGNISTYSNARTDVKLCEVSANGDTLLIKVASKEPYEVTKDDNDWCTFLTEPVMNDTKDSVLINVKVAPNTTGQIRKNNIDVIHTLETVTSKSSVSESYAMLVVIVQYPTEK